MPLGLEGQKYITHKFETFESTKIQCRPTSLNCVSLSVMSELQWKCTGFNELSPHQLYSILRLRMDVFVMEQDCAYQDMDNCDQDALHVTAMQDAELLCYARLLPPGVKYQTVSIGRVITQKSIRRDGFGKRLMSKSLEYCQQYWPGETITISAQQHLEKFYCELGFVTESEPYLEDGIPHIQMRQAPDTRG